MAEPSGPHAAAVAPQPDPQYTLEHVELIESSVRAVVRTVLTVVAVLGALYLVYLLRKPLGWLFLATLLAITLNGPVNRLARVVPRGLAIAAVYLAVLAVPVMLAALVVPPVVTQATNLADNAPHYADQVTEFVDKNKTLRDLDAKYDISGSLQDQAAKLPTHLGDAAGTLSSIGLGVVNSVFALVTILILSAFMVSGGQRWVEAILRLQPPARAERLERVLRRIAAAIRSYVAGAITVATIAGVLAFIVLLILGVPFRVPLAVMVGLFSLVPLVGATIAAVIVGIVTLFTDFPSATIIWTIWAIVYQQVENTFIQPQVQKRALNVNPFVVLVAVLFGSTLFGVFGALVAIPIAASIQIVLTEFWDFRVQVARGEGRGPEDAPPEETDPPAAAAAGPAPEPEPA